MSCPIQPCPIQKRAAYFHKLAQYAGKHGKQVAQLKAVRCRTEKIDAFRRWGLPNTLALGIEDTFSSKMVVWVDDENNGEPKAFLFADDYQD